MVFAKRATTAVIVAFAALPSVHFASPVYAQTAVPPPSASTLDLNSVPSNSAVVNSHPGSTATMTGAHTTIGTANVRSGPGTDFDIVRTLPDATTVEVKGCQNSWCQVDGGYISIYVLSRGPVQLLLTPDATPNLPVPNAAAPDLSAVAPVVPGIPARMVPIQPGLAPLAAAPSSLPASGVATAAPIAAANAVTTANAKVRSGPSVHTSVLGTLPAGSPVTVASCSRSWCLTQYGYVNARLIRGAGVPRPRSERSRSGGVHRVAAVDRGPGMYWGPATPGPNISSSWGARPSCWGGRPSLWSPEPGLLNRGSGVASRATFGPVAGGQGPYQLATASKRPLLFSFPQR